MKRNDFKMTMPKKLFVCILTISSILSCTISTTTIMPEYSDKEPLNVNLAAVVLSDDIVTTDENLLKLALGEGNPQTVIAENIKRLFQEKILHYGRFKQVLFNNSFETSNFQDTTFVIYRRGQKREVQVSIPPKGKKIEVDSLLPDVIIYIDKFTTRFNLISQQSALTSPSNRTFLRNKAIFLLWDNHKGKIVSLGESVGKSEGTSYVTWNKALNGVAKNILARTPFYREQRRVPANTELSAPDNY